MSESKPAIEIQHREEEGRGAFFVEREEDRLAEMTYARVTPKLVIIDHTLVDERLRGLGVARRLLDTAVAWARSTGTKLAATCPYAKAQFESLLRSGTRRTLDGFTFYLGRREAGAGKSKRTDQESFHVDGA